MSQTGQVSFHIDKDIKQGAESSFPFYSENNIRYLNKIIDGIEDGTRPLTEHNLIEVDGNSMAAVKEHYDN